MRYHFPLFESITVSNSHPSTAKHRRFQFSLRTLLVFVLMVALACSWLATRLLRAKRQRMAVAEIRKDDSMVTFRYSFETANDGHKPWLAKVFGEDFYPVVGLTDVAPQAGAPTVMNIGKLTNLKRLDLSCASVNDAAVRHLEGLTKLRFLSLCGNPVTDTGLKHLQALKGLEELDLEATAVTDGGLRHLRGLRNLRRLNLLGTQVGDAGLENLKQLRRLEVLQLMRTQVTDGGLHHLKGLSNLKALYLGRTQVTEEGMTKLQQALPNCEIVR